MPCDIDQMCRLIINAGGRPAAGSRVTSWSAAERSTAKARSDAARSSGLSSGEMPDSNMAA